MDTNQLYQLFAVTSPGFEHSLCSEMHEKGFCELKPINGGVEFSGTLIDMWRANIILRGATRILMRLGEFRAFHLAQLDKRAHKFPWNDFLKAQHSVRVEVTTKKSKIYHAGAAAQRIEQAIFDVSGARISADADICIKVRIDDNLVLISLDSSGESLHKRGYKPAVGKAPMRETLASLFLRDCDFDPIQPLVDPMCGSGTFVIEAAEIALGQTPGRQRDFAFEKIKGADQNVISKLRHNELLSSNKELQFFGYDRDNGAINGAQKNAQAAGVEQKTKFTHQPLAALEAPLSQHGLMIVNPPYGARIGNKKQLFALYAKLGQVFQERFTNWRLGIITTDNALAKATGVKFDKISQPIAHGGLKVRLFYKS